MGLRAAHVAAAGLAGADAVGVVGAGHGLGAARGLRLQARGDVSAAHEIADAADLIAVELGKVDVLVRALADPGRY